MTSADSWLDKITKNSRVLFLGLGAVIVVAALVTLFSTRKNQQAHAAQDAFYLAQKSMDSELKSVAEEFAKLNPPPAPVAASKGKATPSPKPSLAPPTAASIEFKKFDVEAKLPETFKKMKALVEGFPKTRAAFEARLILGDLYMRHGNPAQSVSWYQAAVDSAPSDFDRALALTSLGYAYENSNQIPQAIPTYEKALKLGEIGNRGDLLLALARSYELNHDVAKARSTYDQILSQLPNSEYSRTAEFAKSQLE